jgi:hypothetical protein
MFIFFLLHYFSLFAFISYFKCRIHNWILTFLWTCVLKATDFFVNTLQMGSMNLITLFIVILMHLFLCFHPYITYKYFALFSTFKNILELLRHYRGLSCLFHQGKGITWCVHYSEPPLSQSLGWWPASLGLRIVN